jgi:ATP-binding cassette subfamily B protein
MCDLCAHKRGKTVVKTWFNYLKIIYRFVSPKIFMVIMFSFFLGIALFFIEINFAKYFQEFLKILGVLPGVSTADEAHGAGGKGLIIFGGIALLRIIFMGLKTYLSQVTNQMFIADKRAKILEIAYLKVNDRFPSHEMVSIFSEKLTRAGGTISDLSALAATLVISAMISIWGIVNAPKEFFISIFLTFILITPLFTLDKKIRREGGIIDFSWEKLNKDLIEGIKFFFFLFYHGLQKVELQKSKKDLTSYRNSFLKFYFYSSLKNAFPQIVGLVVVVSVCLFSKEHFKTSPIILISFLYLFIRLAQNAGEMLYLIGSLKLSRSNFENIYNILSKEENFEYDIFKDCEKISLQDVNQIKLKNIGFHYPDGKNVIDNLSVTLNKGEPLVIKGRSGAGKSTFLSILLGYHGFQEGEIIVEKHIVKNRLYIDREDIAYVGPDSFFFYGTLLENLMIGNAHSSLEHIEKILDLVELKKVVDERNALGELMTESSTFSTGQKQRFALARALLRNPKILILDEATANLDSVTETKIVELIKKNTSNCFVIVVSHKDTFDSVDSQQLKFI